MSSRERVRKALRHQPTDRPPIDLGSTPVTGIAASTYHRVRKALGLGDGPVRVNEPYQILAEVEEPVRQALGVDTVGVWAPTNFFGFRNEGWKPWTLPDGTPALVPRDFEVDVEANGDTLIYPRGDRTAAPSARLPKGGYYFDAIVRPDPGAEARLDPEDWREQFTPFTDEDLRHLENESRRLYEETDYALVGNFGGGGIGDIAFVPGPGLTNPKGLRDPNRWYELLLTHQDYIRAVFEIQAEVALQNLELLRQAYSDRIEVLVMSGTDFGGQQRPLCSPKLFRDLWKPLYAKLNGWVHANTPWKVFFHSCGAIAPLLDDFVEVGVDVLNPVQCSAAGMDPQTLKQRYGDALVFWGGGVDTQKTLPFGTVDEVRAEVSERVRILGEGGGFVFNTVHNIQSRTPTENVLALYEVVRGAAA
jgi:uroporphyrinogen-III decarboxylase